MTLAEIGDRWEPVALRVTRSENLDGWEWLLDAADAHTIRKAGSPYLLASRRGDDGQFQLVAKRKRRAF